MSEETTSRIGPNESDSPSPAPENANVFGYDVASQVGTTSSATPNPASPLAAG
jgi:hypothetical protein